MKKIISGLFVAVLLGAGLVAVSGGSAVAAPYPGTVYTGTHIGAPNHVRKGHRAKICTKVTTDGNGRPQGHVTLKVIRARGGFRYVDTKSYNGERQCFRTPRLKLRGQYTVKVAFDRKPGSVYKDSDNRTSMKVIRRHHR